MLLGDTGILCRDERDLPTIECEFNSSQRIVIALEEVDLGQTEFAWVRDGVNILSVWPLEVSTEALVIDCLLPYERMNVNW